MEVGRNLLSSSPSFPLKTLLRNSLSSSSCCCSSSGSASSSVVLLEQRDEVKALLRLNKEDKTSQGVLNKRQIESEPLVHDGKTLQDSNRLVWEFNHPSSHWPGFWHASPPLQRKVNVSLSPPTINATNDGASKDIDDKLFDAIALAKKALIASKEAASIGEDSEFFGDDFDDALSMRDNKRSSILGPKSLAGSLGKENETVKSTRLLERRSKRRKLPKSKFTFPQKQSSTSRASEVRKKLGDGTNSDDPIRSFLAGPESKQLLGLGEECELISRVQDLMKLQQVKAKLESESGRELTMVEWAEAAGLSGRNLQSQIHSGTSSREKLIYSNLRMVVHIAKQYQGRGVGIQDLMQEGSIGLMRSVEKFKPQAGCRFATYAYWWIRQSIRKAIFQHSRTIRLPENMYTLLGKVSEAKRSYSQEGNRDPSQEEIATRVGITVEKLEKLLFASRTPLSLQQTVWADQKVTFQEVTADMGSDIPELSVTKQLMRQHVRGLLRILNPREQQIVKLRYGIDDSNQKSLSEIGRIYGLSKERVRQLEGRALFKLRQHFASRDLGAYSDLLI